MINICQGANYRFFLRSSKSQSLTIWDHDNLMAMYIEDNAPCGPNTVREAQYFPGATLYNSHWLNPVPLYERCRSYIKYMTEGAVFQRVWFEDRNVCRGTSTSCTEKEKQARTKCACICKPDYTHLVNFQWSVDFLHGSTKPKFRHWCT